MACDHFKNLRTNSIRWAPDKKADLINIIEENLKLSFPQKQNLRRLEKNKKPFSEKIIELLFEISGYSREHLYALNGGVSRNFAEDYLKTIIFLNTDRNYNRKDLRYKEYVYKKEGIANESEEDKKKDFIFNLSFFMRNKKKEDIERIYPHINQIFKNRTVVVMLEKYVKAAADNRKQKEDMFFDRNAKDISPYETYEKYLNMLLIKDISWIDQL